MGGKSFIFFPAISIIAGKLETFGASIQDFTEALEDVIEKVMIPSFQTNFAVGGRPPWEPLSDAYSERKSGGSILVLSGALRGAATSRDIWTVDDTAAWIDGLPEDVWYGMVHQDGSATTPARPFILIQPEDEAKIEEVFGEWLDRKLAAHWGLGG
jgi:phage gpG-like protein